MVDNAFVKIGTALLKHQVKKLVGEETLGVISEELADIGGDKLDTWLGEQSTQKELEKVAQYAHDCFHDTIGDHELEQWMISMPIGNLPKVTEALAKLPTSPDEKQLESALREAVADWKKLSPDQVNHTVNSFLSCLRSALLPLERQTLMVIGRSVLRVEEKVNRLSEVIERIFGVVETVTTNVNSNSVVYVEIPEGTLSSQSKLYIGRPEDKEAFDLLKGHGYTVTIKGPRQVGKSSLLSRLIKNETGIEKQVAFLDFQLLDNSSINDPSIFFRRFCSWISDELNIADKTEEYWRVPLGPAQCCTKYIGHYVLPLLPRGLLIAIDETEHIFEAPFKSDFFGMLRSWHNRRQPDNIWGNLGLVMVTSTEPNMFITNPYQSPFNVGRTITVSDFKFEHILELNMRYSNPFTLEQLKELMNLLGGHPYLIHRSINLVASGYTSFKNIVENASNENGIFMDHLQKHLANLQFKSDLAKALLQVINTKSCPDEITFIRLHSAGLILRKEDRPMPRCELYARFFREHLHAN